MNEEINVMKAHVTKYIELQKKAQEISRLKIIIKTYMKQHKINVIRTSDGIVELRDWERHMWDSEYLNTILTSNQIKTAKPLIKSNGLYII